MLLEQRPSDDGADNMVGTYRSVAERPLDIEPDLHGTPRGSLVPEPEAELLTKYGQMGDPEAFRALCERHQDLVFGVCHRILGDADDAEEAAMKCFVRLAHEAGKLKAPVADWLHRVALHTAIDMAGPRPPRDGLENPILEEDHKR